jgi:threonine/homoserine/homoserine lactone efflux protein
MWRIGVAPLMFRGRPPAIAEARASCSPMALAGLVGFVLGLLGAIPVAGPIAVLVITRGLHGHVRSAIAIATGSAVAEGCYAALSFWGLGALVAANEWIEPVARGLGACVLAGLAFVLLRRSEPEPQRESARPADARTYGGFALGFGIAAANPTLIVSWTAAVTVLQAMDLVEFTTSNASAFAIGTTLGIVTWSGLLVHLMWRLRGRLGSPSLELLRRAAGFLVLALFLVFFWRFAASLR